jgi:hypothetical protein
MNSSLNYRRVEIHSAELTDRAERHRMTRRSDSSADAPEEPKRSRFTFARLRSVVSSVALPRRRQAVVLDERKP